MNWVQRFFRRGRLERELDKEIQYDLDLRIAALIAQGAAPQEATRCARLEFGGADQIKEACRDARGARWAEDFIRDSRYGVRTLRRSPVFTSVAILSLALGIGANTAIFSLMDRLMFPSPCPTLCFSHSERGSAASKGCWRTRCWAPAISPLTVIRRLSISILSQARIIRCWEFTLPSAALSTKTPIARRGLLPSP